MSSYRYDFNEIFDAHVPGPYDPERREFIEQIASALYERVEELPAIEEWPAPVRQFYALYDFNFQVGNGGFAQAAYNVPYLFPIVLNTFEILGLEDAAAICRKALAMLPDEINSQIEKGIIDTDSLEDVFEHFDDSELAELDEAIPDEFWADDKLQQLAQENQDAFLSVDSML
jgi:hypothetical protein